MPDLSSSPRSSAIMRSYCSFAARASGRSRPRLRASSRAMPLSLAACAAEKSSCACSFACLHRWFRVRASLRQPARKLRATSLGLGRALNRGQGCSKAACGKRDVNGLSHVRENKRLVTNGLILFTNHKQDISAPSMALSIQPAWRLNKLSIFQILSRTSPRRFRRNE